MCQTVYRYEFGPSIDIEEIEATIVLAIIAIEALHGETATQLGVAHYLDPQKRACVVDASGQVGGDFNSILHGFLRREFGADSFRARRVVSSEATSAVAA